MLLVILGGRFSYPDQDQALDQDLDLDPDLDQALDQDLDLDQDQDPDQDPPSLNITAFIFVPLVNDQLLLRQELTIC